ncbi:hypothetical protein ABEB36_001390 [Hypothenemus hampei]|uniref:C2H2-type domain-containing protein n=1 Tax=Hypothenemus hampei TaxID=57062 RepID=A0ABD1FF06_HYPHA
MDDTNLDLLANNLELDSESESSSQNKRPCNHCGIPYKLLGRHLETHGPHNCLECLLHFPTEREYKEHACQVHNQKEIAYICEICNQGFFSPTQLALHNYKHTEKYCCPHCDFVTRGKHKQSLINHIKRHEGQFSYFCDICGQGFLAKHTLSSHMEMHEDIPKYECEVCQKKFTVKRYLDVHKSLNHKLELYGIEEIYQCEICGRSFTFEKSLIRHLSAIHKRGEDRTVDCPICKKKIANKHNLKKHMRVHTGEKQFCCDLCGKAFAEKKYLQKHQVVHDREKDDKNTNTKKFILSDDENEEDVESYLLLADEENKDVVAKVLYLAYD